MSLKPGAQITWTIMLVDASTLTPLPDRVVTLEKYDPMIGSFRPERTQRSDASGEAIIKWPAPFVEGEHKYRSAWPGDEAHDGDTSPEVRLKVGS